MRARRYKRRLGWLASVAVTALATSPTLAIEGAPSVQLDDSTSAPSILASTVGGSLGELPADAGPAEVTADELTYDRNLQVVTARGGVEILYADRVLTANTVSYDLGAETVTATGDVVLVDVDGTTLFADYVDLTRGLGDGFAEGVRVLLQDGSRAAAREVRRVTEADGSRRSEFEYAVYSACDSCPDDPKAPVLWRLKAIQVIHDQTEREVMYEDAWLEFLGVPVLYTPYLSHADPTVRRKSGLLPPTYGGTRNLGATVRLPYYHVIDETADLTLTPLLTTDEGGALIGEYRDYFSHGYLDATGSVARDSSEEVMGHADATLEINFDQTWRLRNHVNVAATDTYTRRYGFGAPSFLTSDIHLEGFSRRGYASARGLYFQGLREDDDPGETPLVAPLLEWSWAGEPGDPLGYPTMALSGALLSRDEGADSGRISGEFGWHIPTIGRLGDITELDFTLRADAYQVSDVDTGRANGTTFDGTAGRVVPQASLTWRYPLARDTAKTREVLEPIVQAVISPRGQNPNTIPNEDSLDFEFDTTNLFSANRFTGYDRVETGPRVNYGLRWGAYTPTGASISFAIGQSVHAFNDAQFTENSGLSDHVSDIVASVEAAPGDYLNVLYRTRLDRETMNANRAEVDMVIGPPAARLDVGYLFLAGSPLSEGGLEEREELDAGLNLNMSRYWSARLFSRHDLTPDGGPLRVGGAMTYEDECFVFTGELAREFTRDRDFEAGYTFLARLVFKTVGEFQTSGATR